MKFFFFLNTNHFFAHQICNSNYDLISKDENPLNSLTNKVNCIFCIEKECFIIEAIYFNYLIEIISKTNSHLMSVNAAYEESDIENSSIYEEITSLSNYFSKIIKKKTFLFDTQSDP